MLVDFMLLPKARMLDIFGKTHLAHSHHRLYTKMRVEFNARAPSVYIFYNIIQGLMKGEVMKVWQDITRTPRAGVYIDL